MVEKLDPFKIADNIRNKTGYLENIQGYSPWFVNLSLSMHKGTIFYANEMNRRANLSPKMQYDYLYHTLPKGKYWGKYQKLEKSQEKIIKDIMTFYKVSMKMATVYLKILTPEQVKEIQQELDKEGVL